MISPHPGPPCVAALLAALLLAGCVDSAAPLLSGAQPTFGPSVQIHGYSLAGHYGKVKWCAAIRLVWQLGRLQS